MDLSPKISEQKLNDLLKTAQWGWWKADFYDQTYLLSDYLVEFLDLDSDTLAFADFIPFIREDYRERFIDKFNMARDQGMHEQTYPLLTKYGEIWFYSKLAEKETDENGHLIAWGFLQSMDENQNIYGNKNEQKVNNLLSRQNSISHSLLSFLQTEDTATVINQILQDILAQFEGSRAHIFEYDLEKQLQRCTFEVSAPGVSPRKEFIQRLKMNDIGWWSQQLCSYHPIILFNLDELPPEAAFEKKLLSGQGITSLMAVPMVAKDHVWGYLRIDITQHHRKWTNDDYQWFAALGNIISICMELHKSEHQARKEREYFSNLYEYMPIAYARLKILYGKEGNPNNYRFIDLNPAFATITQKPASYFLGKTAHEVGIKPEIIHQQMENLIPLFEGGNYQQTTFLIPKINKHLRIIAYSSEKDEIIVLFSDMTDIVNAHEALDKSEKTLRNIYKNIPVGIEIYDKDGYLRDMNDKNLEIFGLRDKSWSLGVNIFDNPNIPDHIKQSIKLQENVDFELKFDFTRLKNYYRTEECGTKDLIVKLTTLYNSSNQFENYLLIVIDNTETTTAYSRINEFENFFSVIADFAKVGYFKWNLKTETGFALSQWLKNWGEPENRDVKEVIGVYRHVHPHDRLKLIKLYDDLIQGRISGFKEEARIRKDDNTWKWIRTYVTVKDPDSNKDNIELIGVNFDITELKEVETQLIEAKNKAETLDKLKSAFLANMSHEIRTPLNAIVGFSNLLAETDDYSERTQYISIIQENNDLLLQLISDVLDLSKIEAGTLDIVYGDVDINTLCDEIIRSHKLKATEGIILEFENQLPECQIRADRNRLMQIIGNFINNALKFTSHGYIRLGYKVYDGNIEFYVSDTGIGISATQQASVFDRFVKFNSFIHGTGLGLSICKSMVEQMGGKIGVESQEGQGSKFWFTLPFIPANTSPEAQNFPAIISEPVKNGEKTLILIAEDTESNFILISTMLKKEYAILWARTGKEALELYHLNSPALILMDVRMPEMDGLTTTCHIRETDTHTPIIALTAFAFDSDKAKALESGCNEYLSKPVEASLLKETIKKLLG